jgi:drug/metabolite transporter (DMT)-like permease
MAEIGLTDGLTLLAFVLMLLLGGSNAVAVRFSNLELPPFWGATIRFGSAAVILWAIVLIRRVPIARGRVFFGVLIYGTHTVGVSYAFLY